MPYGLTRSADRLYFRYLDPTENQVWSSDGSSEGTVLLTDDSHQYPTLYELFPKDDGGIYLVDNSNPDSLTFWESDGITPLTPSDVDPTGLHVLTINNKYGRTSELWKIDSSLVERKTFYSSGSELLYIDEDDKSRLWVTDGTIANTRLVGEDFPNLDSLASSLNVEPSLIHDDLLALLPQPLLPMVTKSSNPSKLIPTSNGLLTITNDFRLHRIDSIDRPEQSSRTALSDQHLEIRIATRVGDSLFLFGDDSRLLKYDLISGEMSVVTTELRNVWGELHATSFEGKLYFQVGFQELTDLWVSDGTSEGTKVLLQGVGRTFFVNDKVFFVPYGSPSQGGSENDLSVADSLEDNPTSLEVSGVLNAIEHRGELYFTKRGGSNFRGRYEIWKTDGTLDGTQPMQRFAAGVTLNPNMISMGDAILVTDNQGGLYRVTDRSTQLIKQFAHGTAILDFTLVEGRVFFAADDGVHGTELWVSDGTAEGTQLAVDVRPGPNSSIPREMTVWEDHLVFVANDGQHGREIWTLDLSKTREPDVDINDDEVINEMDLTILLANFGSQTEGGTSDGDLDGDGIVDFRDFLIFSSNYTT